jgi:hypothetical protein
VSKLQKGLVVNDEDEATDLVSENDSDYSGDNDADEIEQIRQLEAEFGTLARGDEESDGDEDDGDDGESDHIAVNDAPAAFHCEDTQRTSSVRVGGVFASLNGLERRVRRRLRT